MTIYADLVDDPRRALENRWTDIFKRDTAIHLLLMGCLIAATFQGYLKDRIGGPVPYALADAFLIGAAIVWLGGIAIRHAPVQGPGAVPLIILAMIVVPLAYLILPGTPIVIKLAGLRAWCAFPVAGLIALTVIRTPGQVRAYVGVILLLCIITAVYGIMQYRAGPEAALNVSKLADIRHGQSIFYNITGTNTVDFRAFSTFTFPAPFAGMMVFGILLASGIGLSRHRRRRDRVIALLLVPLFFLGMTVSGTRAALVILLIGLLVLAWYRGLSFGQVLLLPVLLAALYGASIVTAGRILERWQTIFLRESLLWTYVWAPITVALRSLSHHLFGYGLGRSGVGVPFQIFTAMPPGFFQGSDGDIGRAAVELGIFGLVLLFLIIVALLPHAARSTRQLADTPADDIALGLGPLVVSTGVILLIGSPLTSAPHGVIWWFFLGALLKLAMLDDEDAEAFAA